MLNGKFYTGLPPKMVERQGVNVCNRQESHFYWPDDSRAESAVENRVKRRNSQQLEKPVQRITTVQDSPTEVDTRRMFHKEFASSSIQFYDNLQSNPSKRVPLGRGLRRELTPKLTEVRAQELDNKAEDTSNRRQQAYSSKIQFYDYVNEADNATQNNVRRPQMDLNDKREVELNTKNSPKLQVKRNVRSFSVELEPKVTKKPLNDSPEWRRPRPLPQPQSQAQPKKILKQMPQDQDAFDYLENRVRRLQLTRSPGLPKKHVTYNEEAAEYAYYDDREDIGEPIYETRPRQPPNMPTGSRQQQQQQHQQHQFQQQQQQHQRQLPRSFMETSRAKPLNNNNNYQPNASARKILPKLPESPATTIHMVDDNDPPAPSDPRKHLRSSLCFSGDALMVGGQPAQSTAQARRSSAGQRISVGLPD
ncbi:transcription factor SPT20 homolog [Drosophila gunungcola]|uniref:transcription factor SPT20 homolog n=1 Tax=Drosophila gunungcola TaxID=103775 RepID=UPI0022E5AFDF|nr:transcription factor SPT20 homolog [Drosophila gunungcola]